MKLAVVSIGNSRGIRLPKAVLEQCGIEGSVDLEVRGGRIVISPRAERRAGWDAAFAGMAARGDDRPLDDVPAGSAWDDAEWRW